MTTETPAPPAETDEEPIERPSRPETNPLKLKVLQGRYTGPTDIDGQLRMSATLARGRRAVPWQYRDNPGDVLAVIQHAVALDIQIATALDNLVFSDAGVSAMRARLMHALIIRAGHTVQVTHHDGRLCRMVMKRGDGMPGGAAQWTLVEAQNAGLFEKKGSPWHWYQEDMLWARCLSRLARRYAPDVTMGFYVAEELDAIPDDELDSADTSTATDLDGNPVVAPDVEELLTGVDLAATPDTLADLEELMERLRGKWKQAGEEGIRGTYAGTIDGVSLTVKDMLFAWMTDVEGRLMKVRPAPEPDPDADPATVVEPVDLAVAVATAVAEPPPAAPASTGGDAPAGTGKMACGCDAATVLAADGKHSDGCTRRRRR